MNFLFVHNNFPAQYLHIAAKLAADPSHLVAAIGSRTAREMDAIMLRTYDLPSQDLVGTHPFARRFDLECRRAEQVLYTASALAAEGFRPDVIMVHSGWGENLTLRAVFPGARIIVYCEFFYRATGQDVNFDPEFPDLTVDGRAALGIKNASQVLGLIDADRGLSPTVWQRSTFPIELRGKIDVAHEGIDTRIVAPDAKATFVTPSGKQLRKGDEIVTFISRSLEPIRGFHVFMRALCKILKDRPRAEVLVVGGETVSYGPSPPAGTTWKASAIAETGNKLDLSRVHFLGNIDYNSFLSVLRVSAVHLYLSYPFVLSWSLLEAMSSGTVLVASDVPPVREVLGDDCGYLVPFHDVEAIADKTIAVLADPPAHHHLAEAARAKIVAEYDLTTRTLPLLVNLMLGC